MLPSISNQRSTSLPNDTCDQTYNMELEFMAKYLPQQYEYTHDNMSTIIYSRSLKTSYMWPKDIPLTIEGLKMFSELGHTLGIDYTATYCRMFALDVDCTCRKLGSSIDHINENLIMIVVAKLHELFEQTFEISNACISVWRNKCGFHIYTDVPVTLPTHLFLKKQLEVNPDFSMQPIVFEVPSIMPLPYSAKVSGSPYKPVNLSSDLVTTPLTNHTDTQGCLDLFIFSRVVLSGRTVAKITSIIGDEFLIKNNHSMIRQNTPNPINVSTVRLYENFKYMTQFETYIRLIVAQYNAQMTTIKDVNLEEYTEDERVQIRLFMAKFNKLFGQVGDESCDVFVKISALDYGGLYLQPLIAALFLDIQMTDMSRFRTLLVKIYKTEMEQYPSIRQFITIVNIQTFQAYSEESGDSIINHLHFLISHNVLPTQTIAEQINTILEKMTDSNANVLSQVILKACKDDKEHAELIISDLLDKFKKICLELRVLHYDQTCARHYQLDPIIGSSYASDSKSHIEVYESIIRQWVGSTTLASTLMKQTFERQHEVYISEPVNFTPTEYMYSTKMGVFNSAVGLYTAHTRFLRFNKHRYVSIWPHNIPEKMFYAQNESVIEHWNIVKKFVTIIRDNIFELYTHCVFAPAIIQLKTLISIEERFIGEIFTLLSCYKNFDCAHFLVEYYQFDPKIVYLIVHLCNEYGGLEILYPYNMMCSKIFQIDNVSASTWSQKFNSIMDHATYDSTKPTYMEKLESLRGDHIDYVPRSTYLFIIIALIGMTKCDAYKEFIHAFNIKMPTIVTPHPLYFDFKLSTNMQVMKSNMNRACRIVFGENLTPFESTLADELLSICMSANFKPETIINYLTAVGAMFIPTNILKKLLLLQGNGNVGKSLACKKIAAIAAPSVSRCADISEVMKRGAIAEYSTIIINETSILDPAHVKIVTGNDDTSAKRFFSQKYELQQMQAVMFGATNIHVTFKGYEDVDKTSVSRLYAIQFTGQQYPASTTRSSFLSMMIEGSYFSGILSPIFADSVNALRWLSFGIYMELRDINYFPQLDLSCDTCRDYQHTVHYNNSKLYKFIVDSGIIDSPGFFISTRRLLDIVKQNLDKNSKFSSLSIFKTEFEKQYNISCDREVNITNFQQNGLIQHITENMRVIVEPNSIITYEDIKKRLELYTSQEHKDNALAYFQRTWEKYYNYDESLYKDIEFSSNIYNSYEGNETVSYNLTLNMDSLVMKAV